MSQRRFISRFTPSRTNPEDLEKILVQRNELLDDAVARVRESATTGNKHHLLFVGPRGSGKTNLVSLIFHRIDQQADLRDHLRIAWLNEDETSTTFLDFLLRIYRALAKKYPIEFPLSSLEPLYELDPASAAQQVSRLLVAQLADRSLLLLVENLNELFSSLGEDGQKSWRAFLQEHPFFTIVATAQRLFDGVTRRTSPFFGFFQTEHLRPLSVPEAILLLEKIAALNDDDQLSEYLRSRVGRARVRALHHLTGGNHRVYVVLSEFITRDSIAQLVGPFESMIDELTPYYQERLRWLSPLQRRIVERLCQHAQPTPVKDIAKALFSSHQTVASQLKALRGLGYIESHPRGRESVYELSEPLMRLCVEVKENQQRKPLRLIVDFLRVWYDADKLEAYLSALGAGAPERAYIAHALDQLHAQNISPRLQYVLDDLARTNTEGENPDRLQCLQDLVIERGSSEDWFQLATALIQHEKWDEALETVAQARNSGVSMSPAILGTLALIRGAALAKTNQLAASIDELSSALAIPDLPEFLFHTTLAYRARIFGKLSQDNQAIDDATHLLNQPHLDRGISRIGLNARALALTRQGRGEEAISDLSRLAELTEDDKERLRIIWFRGVLLFFLKKHSEALRDLTGTIGAEPDLGLQALALACRSAIFMAQSKWDEAYRDLENAFLASRSDTAEAFEVIKRIPTAILHSAQDASGWRPRIAAIIRLFAEHDALLTLGFCLVFGLSEFSEANLNDAGLDAWVSVWREVSAPHDAMTVPLRLLETGVAYLKTKDEGSLLALPKEERSIVRQALSLPPEAEVS